MVWFRSAWLVILILSLSSCSGEPVIVKITGVYPDGDAFLTGVDIDDNEYYIHGKWKRIEKGDLIKIKEVSTRVSNPNGIDYMETHWEVVK